MAARYFPERAIVIFAALGAVSGAVSALTFQLVVFGAFFRGMPPDATIPFSPGIAFAVALAVAIGLTVTRRAMPIAAMMAASMLGWWIVIEYAAHPVFFNNGWAVNIAHWLGCGRVGALIVGVTGALAGLYERSFLNIAEIGGVGAIFGLLTLWDQPFYWPLFVAWQAAVGATIGHAIVRSRRAAPVPA
ncbi:MAG: hypothetical protein QOG83_526 [Alphaproteobacteria bacterium]|nr:hypothetical protein [Alphaproteobacteria bacterium]